MLLLRTSLLLYARRSKIVWTKLFECMEFSVCVWQRNEHKPKASASVRWWRCHWQAIGKQKQLEKAVPVNLLIFLCFAYKYINIACNADNLFFSYFSIVLTCFAVDIGFYEQKPKNENDIVVMSVQWTECFCVYFLFWRSNDERVMPFASTSMIIHFWSSMSLLDCCQWRNKKKRETRRKTVVSNCYSNTTKTSTFRLLEFALKRVHLNFYLNTWNKTNILTES